MKKRLGPGPRSAEPSLGRRPLLACAFIGAAVAGCGGGAVPSTFAGKPDVVAAEAEWCSMLGKAAGAEVPIDPGIPILEDVLAERQRLLGHLVDRDHVIVAA